MPRPPDKLHALAEDYAELSKQGYGTRQIAERLRYGYHAMRRQLSRARSRGLLPPAEPR